MRWLSKICVRQKSPITLRQAPFGVLCHKRISTPCHANNLRYVVKLYIRVASVFFGVEKVGTREKNKEVWRGTGRGEKEILPLPPSPSYFHFFSRSRFNFRAITRWETLATQAVNYRILVKIIIKNEECGPGVKCRLSVKCRLQTESKTQVGCKMQDEDCWLFKHLCSFFSK